MLQDLSLQSLMQCCIAALQLFCNPLDSSSFKDNCFCGVSNLGIYNDWTQNKEEPLAHAMRAR